jgi:hypothetical protein
VQVEKATENSVEVAGLIFEVGVDGLLILYGVRVPDTPRGNTLRRIFLSAKFETFLSAVQKEAAPALRGNSREYLAELLADKYGAFPLPCASMRCALTAMRVGAHAARGAHTPAALRGWRDRKAKVARPADFPADLGERDLWVAPPSKLNKDELVTVLEWLDKHPL